MGRAGPGITLISDNNIPYGFKLSKVLYFTWKSTQYIDLITLLLDPNVYVHVQHLLMICTRTDANHDHDHE